MVQYWSALAARDTRLMTHVMGTRFPESFRRATWGTYIRCHDDIGWAITPEDTHAIPGLDAAEHRDFLADFYNGSFPMSFARGADFQSNPGMGDRRTNGSLASLAGLEAVLERDDPVQVSLSIRRVLLGHALIASYGGIPLIYMGDEIGMLNDHGYRDAPDLAADGHWMHRPPMDWAATEDESGVAAALLAGTRHIMATRKATPQLASDVPTRVIDTRNTGLFTFERLADDRTVTCLFNFTEEAIRLPPVAIGREPDQSLTDLLTGDAWPVAGMIEVPTYGALWLRSVP